MATFDPSRSGRDPVASCHGALALELKPGALPARAVLDQGAAEALATRMANDLARFEGQAAELDLGLLAATYDPVELLRPGWPLHRELERLVAQAPGAGLPRVIAFADREGRLPENLLPQAEFAGGALRLLPWILRGPRAQVASVGAGFESSLLDTGMAGADTALAAQEAFGVPIEHARYLTLHDLAAMMAMQYEHAGLGAAWPLIETALLAPDEEHWLDAPPEPLVRLVGGEARIALLDDEGWAAAGFAPAAAAGAGVRDDARMQRDFDRFQMRQRQLAALFGAHGIDTVYEHCPAGRDPREVLK
jgi:hypothetical protein